jgi:uroporphyrinogen-III decarboxylase
MTSRERMLAALACQPPDHTPCAFMMYKGLKNECRDYRHFLQAQLDLGLDTVVELPPRPPVVVNDYYNLHGVPVSFSAEVNIQEWVSEDGKVLTKEYHTPDGILRVEVKRSSDWPWGEHVPFLDDHIIPVMSKPVVEETADLPALRHLLSSPNTQDIEAYQQESLPYLDFACEKGLLVAGGWGVGADMVGWLCGLTRMIVLSYRQKDFLHALLDLIGEWNRNRMQAMFTLPLDLYIRRAWYENCDFWTPQAWREFLLPGLCREVELAHSAGVKFGYLLTSKAMPLIDGIIEAGVDVLVGVDPREYDLAALKQKTSGRMCLWGGVNGHLTVEMGTPAEIKGEVEQAMETLAPGGGFILSPVDNVRQFTPTIERNVSALIEAWHQSG